MNATRSLAAALGLGSILGISCYSEPRPPSTYRYACEADGDCNSNEICRQGLCERPCSQLEVAAGVITDEDASDDPCPTAAGYAACFNGACANTCAVGKDYCAQGQECIDLAALGIDVGGGSSNPFGGGSSDPIGICGVMCEPGDDICPDSEVCLMGFCAVDCSQGQVCPDGYDCLFGVCIPATGLPSDDGGSTGAGSGSDGASESSGAATGASDTGTTGMGSEPDDEERR
jgi:hypothetical protein